MEMKLKINTILLADCYKYTQWLQHIPGIRKMFAYGESRGTKLKLDYTRLFGMQGFAQTYLEGVVLEEWMIDEAKELLGDMFGTHAYFNEAGFRALLKKHKGKLPIRLRVVKEGTKLPLHNIQFSIENTDEEFAWIVPWLETMVLRGSWYGKAVCTISSAVMDIQKEFAAICGCEINPFFLNDFGARGVSSHESAEIGGAAHLLNFLGTDTVEGVRWAKFHYGNVTSGYSVFATEHSSTTMYTKDKELDAIKAFMKACPPDKTESFVIDSYDPVKFVRQYIGIDLKEQVLARTAPTVMRPDSGNPVEMSLLIVQLLWEAFGGTVNKKGFKVLDPHVRVIYGDGINPDSIRAICQNLVDHGFSIENICFGMGGKLLQGVDRDTFQDACKLCWLVLADGTEVEVYKDPNTDTGKRSKRGKLKLIMLDGQYKTVKVQEYPEHPDLMETLLEDGDMVTTYTMEEIRNH